MIAYLDCSTGVSGDKFLGALLDIGSSDGRFGEEHLAALLAQLAPEARLTVSRTRSGGIAAIGVSVEAAGESPARTWSSIRSLLASVELPPSVRDAAVAVFEALASAEAQVHGGSPDEVHFHEVGAIDSILDVVGVCAGLHALGVERLVASPVATGWGTVRTSHGLLGVPAPATALLLRGMQTVSGPALPSGDAPGELTTPTGAALLAGLGAGFGPCPPMVPLAVGFGAGTREIGSPNVCRLTLGAPIEASPSLATASMTLLETNLDHLAPEQAAFVAEQLLAEGAADVWLAPIVMKKGRAAVLLSVLCSPRSRREHRRANRRAHGHSGGAAHRARAVRSRARATAASDAVGRGRREARARGRGEPDTPRARRRGAHRARPRAFVHVGAGRDRSPR